MKAALCFIINYEHQLNKEEIWREWIEPNKDILNVYFYYKDFNKIKSNWIAEHAIPSSYIYETSYFHVIPAYLSLMKYGLRHDMQNNWFCFLTDSCCPIISPRRFRYLFYTHFNKSIMKWRPAYWNILFHKRANLALLNKEYHLANDPWFVLKRENVLQIIHFTQKDKQNTKIICDGGLANESIFAIILYWYNQLQYQNTHVISDVTHISDWTRMSSPTSPHIFKEGNEDDTKFIYSSLEKTKYAMFIRKIAPEFPDSMLRHIIYQYNDKEDAKLVIKKSLHYIYFEWKPIIIICYKIAIYNWVPIILFLYILFQLFMSYNYLKDIYVL